MKIVVAANSEDDTRYQSGVIPYRVTPDGIEVLLINTTHGNNWGIPKGGIESHLKNKANAAKEAFEEAGIKGSIGKRLGIYEYVKGSNGNHQTVFVYPMLVSKEFETWPERHRRLRRWFPLDKCKKRVPKEIWKLIKVLSRQITQ